MKDDNLSSLSNEGQQDNIALHAVNARTHQIITASGSSKNYRVTVSYRQLSGEEAQVKKAIIERIMKQNE